MQETIIRGIAQLATPIGREARRGTAMRELRVLRRLEDRKSVV